MPISGNASPQIKEFFSELSNVFGSRRVNDKPAFGNDIATRLSVTHASIDKKADEPLKEEGKVVCELIVTEDMLNGGGNVHGGCSTFVSQSLNMVYHSPATLGDKLRIVNTTITVGARAMSARTEIWNATHHRLVASGIHIKMQPSLAPSAKL
ncbi:hypothetical protein C8J57DRAFT_1305321 [Mycena rebaudengoi]|nr:hypothetical protein C8J57DRAFT_1305321 [Mycena rebaudengoi]